MKKKLLFMVMVFVLLISACAPSQEQINQMVIAAQQTAQAQAGASTQDVNQLVQGTMQALTAQAVSQSANSGSTGSISGKLSYPSSAIPALYVVAFSMDSDMYYWLKTEMNQTTYQIDGLPAGGYHVVAYVQGDGQTVGAYDAAYVCGLSPDCTDNSLVTVNVQAGAVTPNIDPGNWYGGTQYYPLMPPIEAGQNPAASAPTATSAPAVAATGSIAGKLSYPSSFIPSMKVVAFAVGSSTYYYLTTAEGSGTYQLDNLPAGNYHVVSYVVGGGLSGGYTQAVPCGLSAECGDHSLIAVTVTAGQVTYGVDPGDWYAPADAFPAYPFQ